MNPPPSPPSLLAELERMTPALRRELRGRLGDPTRVDDVLQEARLKAWSRTPRGVTNPGGWLRVMVRNLVRQAHREDRRRRRREGRAARPDRTPPATSSLEEREQVARVVAAIEGLPEPERGMVIARYLEGLGAEAIAARHGVSRATVDRRLERARWLLRERSDARHARGHRLLGWLPVIGAGGRRAVPSGVAVGGGVVVGIKSVAVVVAAVAIGYVSGWVVRGKVDDAERPAAERAAPALRETAGPRLAPAPAETPAATGPRSDARDESPTGEGVEPGGETRGDAALGAEAWLGLINGAASEKEAWSVVERILGLGPERSRDVLVAIENRITPRSRFKTCITPLVLLNERTHPYVVDLLRVLARNPDVPLQNFALRCAQDLAWRDMADDIDAFEAWCATFAGQRIELVGTAAARDWVARLERASAAERTEMLEGRLTSTTRGAVRAGVPVLAALREAGMVRLARDWWQDPALTWEARSRALEWDVLLARGQDDSSSRELFTKLETVLRDPTEYPEWMFGEAVTALVKRGGDGVLDLLLAAFERVPLASEWMDLARGAADLGDPRAIPVMIGVIEANNAYPSIYGVGYYGVGKLTGVRYDKSHDGAWWRAWWEENRRRFGAAADLDIPRLQPVAR